MSYQVLARKWRPRNFAEMVGQEHVRKALINALDQNRLHHAFLFTGTRGVGKTTIARILAKSLNCEKGVSSQPCGVCSACQEIDAGRFVDLIEVDAASRTKVDDTRELLDNVQYSPTRARYKVYLIDEVHMLSNHSFNALLKTLEEPPPHVKFLLATTDPQKLPVTVLSRCLQFNLKRLPVSLIKTHLEHILEAESVKAEPAAVELLAQAADGSMRDALSLMDQAIAYGAGELHKSEVLTMLGSIDQGEVKALLQVLADGDSEAVHARVTHLDELGPDYSAVLDDLAALLQQIALLQALPDSLGTMDDSEILKSVAERLAPEDVQLFYQIALTGKRDLPLAPTPRAGFEMITLRMLAFRPASPAVSPGSADEPASVNLTTKTVQPKTAPRQKIAPKPTVSSGETATSKQAWREPDWIAVVESLPLKGVALELARNCVYQGRQQDTLLLQLDPVHQQMVTENVISRLADTLSSFFAEPLKVRIQVGAVSGETAARRDREREAARLAEARNAIERDPNVQALCDTFDTQVKPDSVQPLD